MNGKGKLFLGVVVSMCILVLVISACGPASTPASKSQSNLPPTNSPSPVGTLSVFSPTSTPDMGDMVMVPSTGENSNANNPSVKVSDQSLNNGMLTIEEATSNGPGWVVIYTLNANGQPDEAVGHAALKDGENYNVMVPIDQEYAKGKLEALLHADRGKVGTFEYPGPDGPVMVGVQMIASTFTITAPVARNGGESSGTTGMSSGATQTGQSPQPSQANQTLQSSQAAGVTPEVIVANQPIVDGKIILPEVVSVGEAWVVIHKQYADGTMGPMAGYAHVNDGVNRDVTVPLDVNSTSTIMYAMLHQDVSKKSSPQFPGVDAPIMVGGQMIAPTFEITSDAHADVIVNLGNSPTTHSYLVDGHQMSLYISLQDTPGKSNCSGDCLATWHPFLTTGRIVIGSGVPKNNVGVLLLPDGSRQVTYLNAPLYLYSKDEKPGDVNGQGLDGNWYLVTP